MSRHVTSRARTNKLKCFFCKKKIKKGDWAEFYFNKWKEFSHALCQDCAGHDMDDTDEEGYDQHPFDGVQDG